MNFTYTIFDASPHVSSGTAWDTHTEESIEADSIEDAIQEVGDVLEIEAAGLSTADGYEAGQRLYALVWDEDGVIVGEPTYALTEEDLGVEL